MMRKFVVNVSLLICLFMGLAMDVSAQQQRFPKPEFQSGYQTPTTLEPAPRMPFMEYVDVFVLIAVMSLTTWFIFKKRSRKGILWLSVFSLAYFGFYRNGCICSIGAVQNLSLALFGNNYSISYSELAFFALPLLFALAVGRVFCASACPLGAIQDLVIVKPIKMAPWLQKSLGLFPFVYLGLAVLYAATGTDFIICRYDPFVGIFRLGAEFHMILLGICFLLIGMFVARPYCRFVCPYGAMLKVSSLLTRKHLSITPEECISCHLCKDSCPFSAIDYPVNEKENRATKNDFKKFILYSALIPVMMFLGGWAVSGSYKLLSSANPDVHLANLLVSNPTLMQQSNDIDIVTFLSSGKSLQTLVSEAKVIQEKFKVGGWYLGAFIGLVIGISLLNQVTYRKRSIYEANKGDCLSCGRCMDFCPVGKPEHPYYQTKVDHEELEK
ncbi:MAG TPA: 4Fe-4S binding protein [Bacteroidales bacterium]|nr:4Fe-4S binding protein [Bacteroidales bacterium]